MRLLLISALAAGVLASAGYGAPGGSAVQNVEAQPQQKNNAYEGKKEDKKEEKKEGDKAQEVKVDIDVVVINKSAGGGSKTEELNKPASPGKTHSVTVGGPAGLVYSPETINANINDVVEFKFLAKNHTVTQSNFDKPCVKSGIDSGFMPNDGNVNPAPTYTFQVKSMKATWFYCKQKTGTHCGKGMTFSINPTAEKSHAKFKELAIQQNGTAEAGSSAAPPPPPASAPPTPPPSQTASSNIVQGTGKVENGQCACQCLCGADSLQQGMGIGNYGGWGGQVPAACVPGQKEQKAPEAPPAAAPQASYSAPQSSYAAPSSAEAPKSAPAGVTPIPQSSANGPGAIATGG